MFLLKITTKGVDTAADRLDRIASGAWHRGLMTIVGGLVRDQTRHRILYEKTDPNGVRWKDWAENTRTRRLPVHSLLVYSRRLVASIFSQAGEMSAEIGTPVFYGVFLEEGTKKMVARRFLGLSTKNEDEVMRAVSAFVRARLSL